MYYSACWCSLAGSAACKNCSNNPNRETSGWITTDGITTKYWYTTPWFDSDKYELVEKKDWKLNNLKKELTKLQDTLKEYKDLEKYYANLAVTMEEKINNVESEIKELEK